jgi:uncharacterized protein (TIGR02996 family)
MSEFLFEDPTPEEVAFVEAICEAPADYVPRLVFSDWLEEQGDRRAETIRLQCAEEIRRAELGLGYLLAPWKRWQPAWEGASIAELATSTAVPSPVGEADRTQLRAADFWSDRLAPPRPTAIADWLGGARWDGTTVRYSRRGGFVENLAFESPAVLNQLPEETFRRLPVRGFEFRWARGWNEALEDAGVARRIERLACEFTFDSSALDIYRMVAWLREFEIRPRVLALSHFRSLGVGEWKRMFAELATMGIETLSLESSELSAPFFRELQTAGEGFAPACLGFSGCEMREDGMQLLSTWHGLSTVRLLDLTDNRVTRMGFDFLLDSPFRHPELRVLINADATRAVPEGLPAIPVPKAERRRQIRRGGPAL